MPTAQQKKQQKKKQPQPIDIDALGEDDDEQESEPPKALKAASKQPILTLDENEKVLAKQADFLNIPIAQVHEYTPQHRCTMLDLKIRTLLQDALEAKVKNPLKDVSRRMQEFPGLTETNSAQIKARIAQWKGKEHLAEEDFIPSKEIQVAPDGEEVPVYMEGGDEEIQEFNKRRRDGPTVGIIEEKEEPPDDLVGDRPPKNLADLYARWPMIGNANYYIRIERTKPKTYNGVNCAGLVGEIRGRRITEAEIQQLYGGSEYKLTLYGPDPRYLQDENGDLKIKALTDPFTLFVPVHPPNLNALPGMEQIMTPANPSQPFAPQPQVPKTPSDAAIHKIEKQHEQWRMEREDKKRKEEEEAEARQAKAANDQVTTLLGSILNQSKEQLKHEREEARRREQKHEKEVEAERKAREEKEAAIAAAKEESQGALFKFMEKMGPDREGEIRRLVDSHRIQLETVQRAFEEQIKTMRDRHEGDLRRADERHRDTESQYRLLLEQERASNQKTLDAERQSWAQRERDLRDQAERDKTAMREQFEQRVSDLKDRHSTEVKNLERAQSSMMTVIKESFETKVAVSEQTHGLMMQHAQERLEDARQDAERARAEAEEAKDITTVLEKAKAQAEALGFEKKDENAPKDWKERAIMMMGGAATQLFSNANEWLPQVMEKRQQQQLQMAQLAAAQQQQQQQQQAARAAAAARRQQAQQAGIVPGAGVPTASEESGPRGRTRGAQWASEGQAPPAAVRAGERPLGFQEEQTKPSEPAPAQKPAEQPVVNTEGSEVVQVSEKPSNGAQAPLFPQKFIDAFGYEGVVGFVQQAELHIQSQTDAAAFAELFVAQYREHAQLLAEKFKPEEVVEAIQGIEGAEMSPILSRAGKKWLQGLWQGISKQLGPQKSEVQTTP